MKSILDVNDTTSPAELGAKAAALAALQRAGFPVPAWFVLSSAALVEIAVSGDGVASCGSGARLRDDLATALASLCPGGEPVAVRSSVCEEDGGANSFAGQFESHLGVPPERAVSRIVSVWRSAFGERAAGYRALRQAPAAPIAPAVLVQRMVCAEAAGVAFSADPSSGRRGLAVVAATHGLGCGLASGESDADEFRVDRAGRIVARSIARKPIAYRIASETEAGVAADHLAEAVAQAPAVDDTQACEIAELARRCERHFGVPQDIEWAIADGELHLLQSRPITALAGMPDPDGRLAVWDNSNIAESYSGVTTPLTFSFVRLAYSHVYAQLCRIGGIDAATVDANAPALRTMIGLVRGRIHYNLLSWYQLFSLTPGFRHNRGLLDEMLGLRDEVARESLDDIDSRPGASWLGRASSMLKVACAALFHQVTVERCIRRFNRRVDEALAVSPEALRALRADELVAHWHELVRRLLRSWDAPLVNDYLAMFFHGGLRRLLGRWLPQAGEGLANDLLQGERDLISAEPVRRMLALAALAREEPRLAEQLRVAPPHVLRQAIAESTAFDLELRAYLEMFGDRCIDELKLESATLDDDPLPMLRSVGELARSAPRERSAGHDVRGGAERRVRDALRGNPVRRAILAWVLRNARQRVRERENLRFERTRVFGRVRRLFVELGRRLHAVGALDAVGDVFYLELDELLGYVDGTATCTDLRGLCAVRKAEFARHRAADAPDGRFETRGAVNHGHDFRGASSAAEPQSGEMRVGQPCSSGIVQGRVRVVTDPRNTRLQAGDIVVAERTDPGWVVLLSGAAALVTEHGSVLSHTAIVARELGVPTVTCINGATAWLADGDWIEVDGDRGRVTRRPASEAEQAA